jgi:hypothetical protein
MAFNLASLEADFSVDEYTANVEAEFLHPFQFDWEEGDDDFDLLDEWVNNNKVVEREWKPHTPNAFDYEFDNVYKANCYKKFLCESVREKNLLSFCTRSICRILISLLNPIEED